MAESEPHQVVSPFALEILHRFDIEAPLDFDRPILQQRKYGRVNATYCKPCIIREPVMLSIGGHYSDHHKLHLSDNLMLFHLKYIDRDMLMSRQTQRRQQTVAGNGEIWDTTTGNGWHHDANAMSDFLQSFLDRGLPEDRGVSFDWQRRRIQKSWQLDEKSGLWKHNRLHDRRTYTLPDRFQTIF
ncbi:MAG: hypothetical protein HRU33_17605 [Rhodobacteraceae bacterium]|nr:hypothetical protein [Paracoccaceae bacterium]